MNSRRSYADLTGQRVSSFRVERLSSRDPNGAPRWKQTTASETFADFRRRERREAEQATRLVAQSQRVTEAEAAKRQALAEHTAQIQRGWIRYVNAQWVAGQDDEKICTRQRWFELSPGTRQIVLDAIEKDPTVRISGL